MKTVQIIIIILFTSITSGLIAQKSEALKTTTSQISFAYPIGSNGSQSKLITNHLSFNILYGITGGLEGFELGGITNVLKGDVTESQIAGISNIALTNIKGIQISGIRHIVTKKLNGTQVSGIYKQSLVTMSGVQVGLINSTRVLHGFQLGLISVADSATGLLF
ncbi:MAG: hypothetical protein ACI85Q_000954 [Salibacteraceae bacterium]|jgi:hypothetical protein